MKESFAPSSKEPIEPKPRRKVLEVSGPVGKLRLEEATGTEENEHADLLREFKLLLEAEDLLKKAGFTESDLPVVFSAIYNRKMQNSQLRFEEAFKHPQALRARYADEGEDLDRNRI